MKRQKIVNKEGYIIEANKDYFNIFVWNSDHTKIITSFTISELIRLQKEVYPKYIDSLLRK